MEKRNKTILACILIVVVACAMYTSWVIITPKWSFSMITNKSIYTLEEDVQIVVILENLGFISHSFTSSISDPMVVSIEYVSEENPTVKTQVWYSPFNYNKTEFVIFPNQLLLRTFIWNQTNVANPWLWNTTCKPGYYFIEAFIPSGHVGIDENLFQTWTYINITAT